MRGRSQRTSGYAFPNDHTFTKRRGLTRSRIFACLVLVGAAGAGGLMAGFIARPGVASQTSSIIVDMSASDTVTLRFPADWTDAVEASAETAPKTLAFASADGSMTLFSPRPLYPIPEVAESTPAEAAPTAAVQPEPAAKPKIARAAAVPPAPAAAPAPAAPKITLASASSKPVNVAPKPAHKSNAVLNDSQIASIKKRLALTPDQERYWPAVEAELRKMEYKKGTGGT